MANYLRDFNALRGQTLGEALAESGYDDGFRFLQWLVFQFTTDGVLFKALTGALMCVILWAAVRTLLPDGFYLPTLMAVTLSPVFFGYSSNTIRQGLAMCLLLAALAAASRARTRRVIPWLLLAAAVSVHFSALVPAVIVLVVAYIGVSQKLVWTVWLSAGILFVTGVNEAAFSPLVSSNQRVAEYLAPDAVGYYGGGTNRLDFLAVSVLMVAIVRLLTSSGSPLTFEAADRVVLNHLSNVMILWNAYFLFLGFIAFSDRVASFSWFMFPVVMGYAVFRSKLNSDISGLGFRRAAYVIGFAGLWVGLQGWPNILEIPTY